jgi:hypothetical protein
LPTARDGITIGEGADFVFDAKKIRWHANAIVFAGIGESADAHHISAPHPDGIGAEAAMRAALADAKHCSASRYGLHQPARHRDTAQRRDGKRCGVTRVFGNHTSRAAPPNRSPATHWGQPAPPKRRCVGFLLIGI